MFRSFSTARLFLLTVLSTCLLLRHQCIAQQEAVSFASLGSGFDYTQGTYSLGWRFDTSEDVTVTSLGFYDDLKNGLTQSHEVGIFSFNTCQLLASTTVTPADQLIGFFRYKSISPVVLPGGQSYYIAAVTGSEKYAVGLSSITTHPAITFVGFSIYGATEISSVLRCPNGSQSVGFKGDFGPNFLIAGNGNGNGNGGGSDNKRPTATSLFCNRTGPNLETARCSVTVGDAGAPPRVTPTGAVRLEARDGFFPGEAECLLSQTQFSPGVASCEVQFAVPFGFPIAVKFPIDAAYDGNDTFKSSATSHNLIKAGCISTPDTPCPNSIGLSFEQYPQIVKNKLALYINCGGGLAQAFVKSAVTIAADNPPTPGSGTCSANGVFGLDIGKFIKDTTKAELDAMAEQITTKQAQGDIMLQMIEEAAKQSEERWRLLQENQRAIFEMQQDIYKNRLKTNSKGQIEFEEYIRSVYVRRPAGAASKDRLTSEPLSIKLKPNSQKKITLKTRSRLNRLISVARKAGITELPLYLELKVKQKGVKGTGTITQSFDATIN